MKIKRSYSFSRFIYLLFLFTVYSSCNDSITGPENTCNTDCNLDCYSLDKEACECILDIECQCSNGVKDGYEVLADCGGDCQECSCTDEGELCALLTNGSQKTWKLAFILEPETGDTITSGYIFDNVKDARFTYFADHTLIENNNNIWNVKLSWEFDDFNLPTKIICEYFGSAGVPTSNERTFIKLNKDTLQYDTFYDSDFDIYGNFALIPDE